MERSLWEMFTSLFQRIKLDRVAKREQKRVAEAEQQKTLRHLLTVPYSTYRGPEFQALIDQVMNHDPYEQPLLQKGKLINVAEEERKYLQS